MSDQTTLLGMLPQVEVRLKLIDAPPLYGGTSIKTPQDAIDMMRYFLSEVDREYFCVVNLDSALKPLHFNVVSMGDIASAIVPIQNVFKTAILSNASSLMCFHSHPSGIVTPSNEDIVVTKRVAAAGNLLNITITDHIIIGGGTGAYYSFKEHQPELFKTVPILEELPEQHQTETNTLAAEASRSFSKETPPKVHKHR